MCTTVPHVIQELLNAWEHGNISVENIQVSVSLPGGPTLAEAKASSFFFVFWLNVCYLSKYSNETEWRLWRVQIMLQIPLLSVPLEDTKKLTKFLDVDINIVQILHYFTKQKTCKSYFPCKHYVCKSFYWYKTQLVFENHWVGWDEAVHDKIDLHKEGEKREGKSTRKWGKISMWERDKERRERKDNLYGKVKRSIVFLENFSNLKHHLLHTRMCLWMILLYILLVLGVATPANPGKKWFSTTKVQIFFYRSI